MAKWANSSVMDAALDKVATGTNILVCTSQPADRASALAAALANQSISGSAFTKANGDVSGRKVTIAQQSTVAVSATGTATHVAIIDGANLLYVTTCTSQALSAGNTVTIPAWKIEIAAPS